MPPQPPGLTRPLAELTEAPRRYGWHGTLVAPFRLADGVTQHDVLEAARAWAQHATALFRCRWKPRRSAISSRCGPPIRMAKPACAQLAASALQTLDALARAAVRGRSRAPLGCAAERTATRAAGRMGLSVRVRRIPFSHDAVQFARRCAERAALVAWWQARTPALGPLAGRSAPRCSSNRRPASRSCCGSVCRFDDRDEVK